MRVYVAIHLLPVNYKFPSFVASEILFAYYPITCVHTVKLKYFFSKMVLCDAFHTKYTKHLRKRNYYLVYQIISTNAYFQPQYM